jgi:hypothetical protein
MIAAFISSVTLSNSVPNPYFSISWMTRQVTPFYIISLLVSQKNKSEYIRTSGEITPSSSPRVRDGLDTPPSAPESWETARREALYSVDSGYQFLPESGDLGRRLTGVVWRQGPVGLHVP